MSNEETDRRHAEANQGAFTLLFDLDGSTIIDAGVGGNSARYINHSCSPNCEALNDGRRIFIDALGDIRPGEALNYDYLLETEEPSTPHLRAQFRCNCGARRCRGTLLNVNSVASCAKPPAVHG